MGHDDLVGEYLTKTAELLDTIEGKVRHIRTPAGAARYGGNIGDPITADIAPGKPSSITPGRVAMWNLGDDLEKNRWHVNRSTPNVPWKATRSLSFSPDIECQAEIVPSTHGQLTVRVEARRTDVTSLVTGRTREFFVFYANASDGLTTLDRRIKREAQRLDALLKDQR